MKGLQLFSPILAAALLFGFQGQPGPFTDQGRNLTEGRIFSFACYDFNRDGRPDLVISDYLNPPRILYNDADLGFHKTAVLTAKADISTSGHGVVLGDFDRDGNQDIFLVYNNCPSRVLMGDGNGQFTDSGQPVGPSDFSGTSAAVADIEGDGDLDIIVTYHQEQARLYVNDGKGGFAMSEQTFGESVVVGDIDGDGDVDIVCRRADKAALILLNKDGVFSQEREIEGSGGFARLELNDIDKDGDLDMIAGGRNAASALFENDGSGSFERLKQAFGPGTRIAIGDIDADGNNDIVFENAVWLNRGGGRFENVQTIPLQTTIATGLVDIDGDGDLDLLASDLDLKTAKGSLRLFLNGRVAQRHLTSSAE